MRNFDLRRLACYALCGACAISLQPATADDARVRELLRSLTGRLRSAETERNNLLSEKAKWEQDQKTLSSALDAANKQITADKDTISTLTATSNQQETKLAAAKIDSDNCKTALEQLTESARATQTAAKTSRNEVVLLEREVTDLSRKNHELHKLATEILTRYEKFGLGDAISAREPFTGLARVKLENLVQDYSDRLATQRSQSVK